MSILLLAFLQIVEVLRHFVMLLTLLQYSTTVQPVLYTRSLVQWNSTGFCLGLTPPEMQVATYLAMVTKCQAL